MERNDIKYVWARKNETWLNSPDISSTSYLHICFALDKTKKNSYRITLQPFNNGINPFKEDINLNVFVMST